MYNKEAMNELKKLLIAKYSNYIERVILFGSRVENKENDFSDYDLLLILKQEYDWKLEKEIKYTLYDIDFEFDILSDIKLISKKELNTIKGRLPFVQDALTKGIVL